MHENYGNAGHWPQDLVLNKDRDSIHPSTLRHRATRASVAPQSKDRLAAER